MERSLSLGRGRWRLDRALSFGILFAVLVVVTLSFWPGHMSGDTFVMIDQAAGDEPISDHHSAILTWLWSLGWPIGLRPGAVLTLQIATFLAGAYLVARAAFRPIAASIVAAAIAVSPPVLGYLGTLSRDTWFIALLLLGFGLVILATRRSGRQATLALVAAGIASTLCLASRQNAATAVVLVVAAIVAVSAGGRLSRLRPLARLAVVLGIATTATAAVAAGLLIAVGVAGVERARPEQQLFLYDLAALSVREGESLLPEAIYPEGDVATLATSSSIDSLVPLIFGDSPPIHVPLSEAQVGELREAWFDEISNDPVEYLDLRVDAWGRQLALTRDPVFVYHPGIDANSRGYEIEFTRAHEAVTDYLRLFAINDVLDGSIVHRPWIYLVLATFAAVALLRRPTPLPIVGALAASAWMYQIGLFFGTMGTVYRFEYPIVVIGMITSAVAVKAIVDQRSRAGHPTPATSPAPPAEVPIAISRD